MERKFLLAFFVFVLVGIPGYSQPCLTIDNSVFDFGEAIDGAVVEHVFVLKNTGDAVLKIFRIAYNCSCTSYEIPKTEIASGEWVPLTVRFNTTGYSAYSQPVSQTLTIFSNDPVGPYRITVQGRVLSSPPTATTESSPGQASLPSPTALPPGVPPKPTLVNLQVDLVTSEDAEAVLPILELIESYGWRTTVYVTGEIALAYPNLVKEIHDRGHQIGVLGWEAGEDLLSLSEEELYDRLENAFLVVRAAVGDMRPQYIADFKPQGYLVNEALLRALSRLRVRSCSGKFSDGPGHPHHVQQFGIVAIPLAEGVPVAGCTYCEGSGEVLASDVYAQHGHTATQFFADLQARYDVNRNFHKPIAAAVRPSTVASGPGGLEGLRNFVEHVVETSGYLVVVDQLTSGANPFIDWIRIEAPATARAGEEITVTIHYYANCYCPWYYFRIYGCKHGWECGLPLVRKLFWKRLGEYSWFPPNVGEHTFTIQINLPLAAKDYTYRLVVVGQACHGGPCWPTYSETIPAKHDAIASTEIQVIAPPVRLLFVPLNWNTTQEAFDSYVTSEVERFIANTPLRNCSNPVYAHKLSVSDHNITNFTGSLAHLRSSAKNFLKQMGLSIDLFNVVVGVAPSPIKINEEEKELIGLSNSSDTVWIVDDYTFVLAHELGHIKTFGGLWDEYCSRDAGSIGVPQCNSATQQPNPLDRKEPCDCPADGSPDSTGIRCCNAPDLAPCQPGKYNVCCHGNKVEGGGRCIMSYAGAPEPRGFCIHCQARLNQMPLLTECAIGLQALSTNGGMNTTEEMVVVLELLIFRDGSVEERDVGVRFGTPASLPWSDSLGAYTLRIIDIGGNTAYEEKFNVFFGYTGPVLPGVDYSNILYDEFLLSVRIPFVYGMYSVMLHYGDQLIYTRTLPVATIQGAVTAGGVPVAGALISARGPDFASARTDDQGRYVIAVTEPGQYFLSVEPADPNLMPAYQTIQVELEQVYTVDFTLEVGGSIAGRVTDAAGNPVTEAWIYPQVWEPPYYKVNENGEYIMTGLQPGMHTIAIDAPGYGDWYIYVNDQYVKRGTSVTVEVELGKTTRVDFTQRSPGTGVVYDFEYASQAEAEAAGWSFTGLWRLITEDQARRFSPRPTPFPSPTRAAYFGTENGNYVTLGTLGTEVPPDRPELRLMQGGGRRSYGELTSPTIPVSGVSSIELSFQYFRVVEYYPKGSYDKTYVQVSFDGGSWETVWSLDSTTPSEPVWKTAGPIVISVPTGASTMRVRFVFDSVDHFYNNYLGWLIDNIRIMSTAPGVTRFTYSNLAVNPTAGPVPLRITASATVTNIGTTRGTETVRFFVDGVERATRAVTLDPGASTTVSFDYTFTEPGSYSVTIDGLPPVTVRAGVTLFYEGFEAGATGWEFTSLWHIISDGACFQCEKLSGSYAYYAQGCNYDTRARTEGTLTSPVIDLQGAQFVQIRFDHFRHVEQYAGGDFDRTRLEVSFDDGSWTTVWMKSSKHPSPECGTVTIGPFAVPSGANSMRLRFVFDSVDKYYNNFPGWAVDNVTVAPASSGQPLAALAIEAAAPRSLAELISVFNVPNPVRDVHTTTFVVRGVEAEEIRVEVYDLTGRLVWQGEGLGNELSWGTQHLRGLPLANGVYLWRVWVRVGEEWVASAIQKLVILR